MTDRHRNDRDPVAGEDEGEESFLARWSRRKRGSAQPAEPEPVRPPADTPEPGATEEAGYIDDQLPPVESLGPDSDYSAYLSNRVSEGLRRAALRKLFGQPAFNVRDGLDDYDDDYRSFAALGDIVTADMRHHKERLMERERQREQERAAAAEPQREAAEPGKVAEAGEATGSSDAADGDGSDADGGDESHDAERDDA